MATEKLIIELDAKTSALQKELDAVSKKLDVLEDSAESADSGFDKLSKGASVTAAAITGLATAGFAAGTALTALVTVSAKNVQELEQLSRQAKLSTEDFQSLAFATSQYGVEAEQIADISKDISDKVGEFAIAGTGAFQDYADALGLTQEEAIATAKEFENLSSDQVIGEVVRQLEQAGASANETTFVLESLGNDLSKLTPLFADNSKELNTLRERYAAVNDQLALTSGQQEDLRNVATSFDLLTQSFGNAANVVASSLAPQFDSFFNAVISIVPDATDTIVDFINSFQDASAIESTESLNRLIEEQKLAIENLEKSKDSIVGQATPYISAEQSKAIAINRTTQEIINETQRLKELEEQLAKVEAREKEAAARREGGSFTDVGTGVTSTNLDQDTEAANSKAIADIENRFKTEEQLLSEKLENELAIIGENNELRLQLEAEFQNNLLDLEIARVDEEIAQRDKKLKAAEEAAKAEAAAEEKYNKDKLSAALSYTNAAVSLGNFLFEDNKAVRAGLVVADTAAGITRAFADLPYPAAVAASASIAASGAAQLQTINSATVGGGSSASTVATADVSTEIPETSELTVSQSDVSGGNQGIVLTIESDDSETADFISKLLENAQVTGTV